MRCTTFLAVVGKFGSAGSFAITYVYTAELYPTAIRNTAVGTAAAVGRLGGIAAPILANLSPISLPMTIMGSSSLIGGFLAIFLPETLGMPLPESLDDVRNLSNNPKVHTHSVKFLVLLSCLFALRNGFNG